jgi:hypothetical protein
LFENYFLCLVFRITFAKAEKYYLLSKEYLKLAYALLIKQHSDPSKSLFYFILFYLFFNFFSIFCYFFFLMLVIHYLENAILNERTADEELTGLLDTHPDSIAVE